MKHGILIVSVIIQLVGCQITNKIDVTSTEPSKMTAHFSHQIVANCPFGHTQIRHIPFRLGGCLPLETVDDDTPISDGNDSIFHSIPRDTGRIELYNRDVVYGTSYDVEEKKWYIACMECGYVYDQMDKSWRLALLFDEIDHSKFQIVPNIFINDSLLKVLKEDDILNYEQIVYPDKICVEYLVFWPKDSLSVFQYAEYLDNVLNHELGLKDINRVQLNPTDISLAFFHNDQNYSIEIIGKGVPGRHAYKEVSIHSSGKY